MSLLFSLDDELKLDVEKLFRFKVISWSNFESDFKYILKYACKENNISIIRKICARYEISSKTKSDVVIECIIEDRSMDIIELLINDLDLSIEDNKILICACYKGNLKLVKLILNDNRVDPTAPDNEPFINACTSGNLELVEFLLSDFGIDPSEADNDAFIEACECFYLDIVKCLLMDNRVNPADQDNSAIKSTYRNLLRIIDDNYVESNKEMLEIKSCSIIALLLNRPEVYNSLTDDELKKYSEVIGG